MNAADSRAVVVCERSAAGLHTSGSQAAKLEVVSRVGVPTLVLVVLVKPVVDKHVLARQAVDPDLYLALTALPR